MEEIVKQTLVFINYSLQPALVQIKQPCFPIGLVGLGCFVSSSLETPEEGHSQALN